MRHILVLLVFSSGLYAVDLKLPSEVKGAPAAFVSVKAETSGKMVRWIVLDNGLNLFPVELLKDSKTAVVSSARPGRYRLLAVTAAGDEPSEPQICTVIIGDAPAPTPPGPPNPDNPADPLTKALQEAFNRDTTAEKAKHSKSLATVYKQSIQTIDQVMTAGQLFAAMRAASAVLVPADAVPELRKAIAEEIKKILPSDPQIVLSDQQKNMSKALFGELANALESLK